MSDLTDPGFEPQTFRTDSNVFKTELTGIKNIKNYRNRFRFAQLSSHHDESAQAQIRLPNVNFIPTRKHAIRAIHRNTTGNYIYPVHIGLLQIFDCNIL